MTMQIIDASLGLQALRQAGYRSTGNAVAELIDNSIEAEARDIEIIACSESVLSKSRHVKQITRIAVLDNGKGMNDDELGSCLSMGWGTRLQGREGLGRFGFGLKGSSISQCKKVEVYSWTKKSAIRKAYLDLDEVEDKNLQTLPEIKEEDLPFWISNAFKEKLSQSGTLVVWSNFDLLTLKKPETLVRHLNQELCRVYRHFLDDDDKYGLKRNIRVHDLDIKEASIVSSTSLKANDPLYLLTPNNVPSFGNKSTNELQEDFVFNVKYEDPYTSEEKSSEVRIITSIAKPETQDLGGNTKVGKHYSKNTGISFVRAGRELELGYYGYIDSSEPRHRWWGIEVRFEPVLDEYFGVTNNKQEVRNVYKLSQDEKDEMSESSELRDQMLLQLNKILDAQIGKMMTTIKHRKEGSRTNKNSKKKKKLLDNVNNEVRKDQKLVTVSQIEAKNKTEEQKLEEKVSLLMQDNANLAESDAIKIAKETIDNLIEISTHDWPGDLFLDRRTTGNGSAGVINRGTSFYDEFWSRLEAHDDPRGHEALQVIIMAMIRAEDELTVRYSKEIFATFRQKWGEYVARLIPLVTENN